MLVFYPINQSSISVYSSIKTFFFRIGESILLFTFALTPLLFLTCGEYPPRAPETSEGSKGTPLTLAVELKVEIESVSISLEQRNAIAFNIANLYIINSVS